MTTSCIIYAVQESTKSIEGLHAMHTGAAVLVCDEMVHHRLVQGLDRVGQIRQVGVPNQLPAEMLRYFGRVGLCTWDTRSVNSYCICDTSALFHLCIRVSRGLSFLIRSRLLLLLL